jgi:phage-related protein
VPQSKLLFFREADGSVPLRDWLEALRRTDRRAFAKCVERLQRLAAFGHELRRPHADILRDGIYELRARHGGVNYRMLYFFHGGDVVVLAHGLTKEGKVPSVEIDRAVRRKAAFEEDPGSHTHEEADDGQGKEDQ